MIDHILGVIDADGIFAFDPQFLGTLRPGCYDHGAESHSFERIQRQRLICPDGNVPKIKHLWIGENFFELLSETGFHLFFIDKDAVFGQTARLDVPIEQDDTMPGFDKLARAIDSGRSRTDDND